MAVLTTEFVVRETGRVALYYPRDQFTLDEVKNLYGVGSKKRKPKAHPVLQRFRVVQVDDDKESYVVVRFDR